MKTTSVRCIFVDAKNKDVREVQLELPLTPWYKIPRDHFTHGHTLGFEGDATSDEQIQTIWRFRSASDYKVEKICHHGYLFDSRDPEDNRDPNEIVDVWSGSTTLAEGDGLIVSYRGDRKKAKPIDCVLSVEEIRSRIAEWTMGSFHRVPEFTCMWNEIFDAPGNYEFLLRIENKEEINYLWEIELDRPISQATGHIVNFSLDGREITIVIGMPKSLEDKVRVMLLRTGEPELKQIDSTFLTASKVPQWVKLRLQNYFSEELVGARFPNAQSEITPSNEVNLADV